MSAPLYEIASDYRAILDWMDDHAEELAMSGGDHPELVEYLDKVEANLNRKAESIALLVQEQKATADAVKAEADRLAARARTMMNRADSLKGYLLAQLRRAGVKKAGGTLATVSLCKNPRPSIAVPDGAEIPEQWRRVVVTLDGTAAYESLKAAGTLPDEPGVYEIDGLRVERGQHVRIR